MKDVSPRPDTIIDVAQGLASKDVRYAALVYFHTGDASYLPEGPAWTRDPGADPNEHHRRESAKEAIDYAKEASDYLNLDDAVWILFCADNPNEQRDPYPDVSVGPSATSGKPRMELC